MNSKPLTYDSSKTVIQYLNPNTRFLIYSRIPSIRTVERAVPLIIDRLSIQDHKIWVNNTSYKYDIYQVDCKDNLPYLVSGVSSLNEIRTCDVDEFRIRDFITKAGGMLPGNPGRNLFGYFSQSVISTNEDRFQKLDELLEMEKQQLEQLLNFQPSNNSNQDEESEFYRFLNLPVRAYEEEDLKILKNEEMVKKAIEDKKTGSDKWKMNLFLSRTEEIIFVRDLKFI
uniref:WH1 domain-containing protein n=1 Tax=Caenorhabditis tropicalis TaxID=1561998 RepID=A0A1I7TAI2_9PELO